MPTARAVGVGFFPLDHTLDLLGGTPLTPHLLEGLVRLGASVPFEQAPALLAFFTGVHLTPETVRRWTEAAGEVQLALERADLEAVLRHVPPPPDGPAVQLFSADGVLAPLVGGEWSEVKTLALGTVTGQPGEVVVRDLTYIARLADAATFGWQATVETHRRGTLAAGTVVAVQDGAAWLQGLVDLQCPAAVRILDFPHALGHLGEVAQAVFGAGSHAASEWLGAQAHTLRHGDPASVVADLADLAGAVRCGAQPASQPEAARVVEACLAYLGCRLGQLQYQRFVAQGYPIGSGSVESANKVLVEARLKGSGMRWARENVNRILVLRCLERNRRWGTAWPDIWQGLRGHQQRRRRQRAPASSAALPNALEGQVACTAPATPVAPAPSRPKLVVNGKPTADHPWRRTSPFRAKR